MKNKLVVKVSSYLVINTILAFTMLFSAIYLPSESRSIKLIVYIYIMVSFLCGFVDKKIGLMLPTLIIRTTGFVRYFILPMVMISEGDLSFQNAPIGIMCAEIVAVYSGIFLFAAKNSDCASKVQTYAEVALYDKENLHLGVATTITLILGTIAFVNNPTLFRRFIFVNSEASRGSGLYELAANALILMIFLFSVRTIEKVKASTWIKTLLILFLGIMYVGWSSNGSANVSRWGIILSVYMIYVCLRGYHKNTSIVLLAGVVVAILLAITVGTFAKYDITGRTYSTNDDAIRELFTGQSLNAYFSGYKNMSIGQRVAGTYGHGLNRVVYFIADFFTNAPGLTSIFSNMSLRTGILFNSMYYGSSIARDQIIPLSIQLYIYFGWLFVIAEAVIVYMACKFYKKMINEKNLLLKYCYVQLTFTWSLVNCFNFTIMMQYVWICVLPVLLIYIIDYKYNKSSAVYNYNKATY